MVSSVSPETEHTPAKAMTVSRDSPAAVPAGGGKAWLRCQRAVARPGRTTSRRAEPHISDQAPPVWRAPEGPEGTGGLRHRPLRAAGSRVAISRAGGPDGAQNTSEAASNKLNGKFRLRHWCGGRRWDRTARLWCGGTAAPGPRAPGSGCAPASAPLGHCPHHLGPRHAGRTSAHLGLSGAVEP